jgi:sulfate adenylyltransferase
VTLEIPATMAEQIDTTSPLARVILLTDLEGAPIAAMDAVETWPTTRGMVGVAGPVRQVGDGDYGPFRRLRTNPADVRQALPQGRVLGVIADRPLHRPQLAQIARAARTLAAHLLVLVPVAIPGPDGLAPEALVRCVLAARARCRSTTIVVLPHPRTATIRNAIRAQVATAYESPT